MKDSRFLSGLLLGLFLLATAIPRPVLAAFSNADLAGTWYFSDFSDYPFSNDPGWIRGTVTINSSGTITGGTMFNSYGASASVTGGSLSLNSSGVMSGSITAGGITSTISHGKMDAGKTFGLFVGIDNDGYRFTGSAIKTGLQAITDFDADGKTDIAVYQTTTGNWFWVGSTSGFDSHLGFGGSGFLPVQADYDGDGFVDTAVYDTTNGNWFIAQTTAGFTVHPSFGGPGYLPVPGDYDGDGKVDIAVYETSSGNWFYDGSTSGFGYHLAFGGTNFIPVPADYDGDGVTDTAVYDTTNGNWFISQTTDGFTVHPSFGGAGYLPFPGDYDGDGKTDIAVYEKSSGNWFYVGSTSGFGSHIAFGGTNFTPVPGDYDGDGKTDTAVYDTTNGNWFIAQTTAGFTVHPSFGGSGYVPVLPQVTILRAMGALGIPIPGLGTIVITGLPATDTDGNYTLTWTCTGGLCSTSYHVEEDSDTTFSSPTDYFVNNAPVTASLNFTGKTPGTYCYRVEFSGMGNFSAPACVTVTAISRSVTITNSMSASLNIHDVVQFKVSTTNNFGRSDFLTDDPAECLYLPGESIAPGHSRSFDITVGQNYFVFIGIGIWDLDNFLCSSQSPWFKRRFFTDVNFNTWYVWTVVQVSGHESGDWVWNIQGSYLNGTLQVVPEGSPGIAFNVTAYNPIP